MNLTTAQSVNRAREIGVRKVIGAQRKALIWQFMMESVLITVFAVIFSLILVVLVIPIFNKLTLKEISVPFNSLIFWENVGYLTAFTAFVSGSYPAFYLSSFNPLEVLKGKLKIGSSAFWLRKGLVVFQFILSAILIIGTITVTKQIHFIQLRNLGYAKDNLIIVPAEGKLAKQFDVFKNEALKVQGVQLVTSISNTLTFVDNSTTNVYWDGKDINNTISFSNTGIGYDFVKTLRLKLLAGRDFDKGHNTDSTSVLINEAAASKLGYREPMGRLITLNGRMKTIIGLIRDFHFKSLHQQIGPLILWLRNEHDFDDIMIRCDPAKIRTALAGIQVVSRKLNPEFPFTYQFADVQYQNLYQNEEVTGRLSNIFASMAIFISCLGLLGLVMFAANQRVKEIGIRKVLGASLSSLFLLLSSEFFVLVLIAMLIASPFAWIVMNRWLNDFAYHTQLGLGVFALSGGLLIVIALATVSFQAIKAALLNPTECLRSE